MRGRVPNIMIEAFVDCLTAGNFKHFIVDVNLSNDETQSIRAYAHTPCEHNHIHDVHIICTKIKTKTHKDIDT